MNPTVGTADVDAATSHEPLKSDGRCTLSKPRRQECTRPATLLENPDYVESVSTDTGHLPCRDCGLIEAKGATPYMTPKETQPGEAHRRTAWKRTIRSYRRKNRQMDERLPYKTNCREVFLATSHETEENIRNSNSSSK